MVLYLLCSLEWNPAQKIMISQTNVSWLWTSVSMKSSSKDCDSQTHLSPLQILQSHLYKPQNAIPYPHRPMVSWLWKKCLVDTLSRPHIIGKVKKHKPVFCQQPTFHLYVWLCPWRFNFHSSEYYNTSTLKTIIELDRFEWIWIQSKVAEIFFDLIDNSWSKICVLWNDLIFFADLRDFPVTMCTQTWAENLCGCA